MYCTPTERSRDLPSFTPIPTRSDSLAKSKVASITVSDNGRGIPADRLTSIFDPFVQVERSANSSSQQGVGLGLAISRELARAMNGDITVVSVAGKGSTFTLRLPRFTADSAD